QLEAPLDADFHPPPGERRLVEHLEHRRDGWDFDPLRHRPDGRTLTEIRLAAARLPQLVETLRLPLVVHLDPARGRRGDALFRDGLAHAAMTSLSLARRASRSRSMHSTQATATAAT